MRRTAILRAEHTDPPFQAFRQGWKLQQTAYEVLSRYGVGPGEIRVEQGSEAVLSCNVLALGMVVTARLSHLEIFVMEPRDGDATRHSVVREVLEAFSQFSNGYRMFSLSLDHHGALEGTTAMEYIGRYVTPPQEGMGSLTGSSAAFYYGPVGNRVLTSVHLEPSSLVPGGLFVKTSFVWQSEGVSFDALMDDARAAAGGLLAVLGLQPDSQPPE